VLRPSHFRHCYPAFMTIGRQRTKTRVRFGQRFLSASKTAATHWSNALSPVSEAMSRVDEASAKCDGRAGAIRLEQSQISRETMPVSLYTASVPVFVRMLKQLLHVLDMGEANAAQRKIRPEVLVNARLAPDMNPLSFQIQSATDRTKFFVARVTGQTPPSWPDEEKTFDELRARINKALDYLATFKPADIDGKDDTIVTLRKSGADVQISAVNYLFNNAYPNFFFHVTTAYDILRHNGVPVGKADFVGDWDR
jgi:uncharacterized protein